VAADWRRCCGRSTWAVWVPCVADQSRDPDHADQLRIDLDPSPGSSFPTSGPRRPRCVRCSTNWASAQGPRHRESGHSHLRATAGAVVLHRGARRRGGPGPRAAAAPPRVDHAAWWKEERGQRVFVDFNQNAPTKRCSGRGRCGPDRGSGVHAVCLGRARRGRPRRVHHRHRAGPAGRSRRPVGHAVPEPSRWNRCSRWSGATRTTGWPTHRGRRSIPRCRGAPTGGAQPGPQGTPAEPDPA